jgi:hypothetical protein
LLRELAYNHTVHIYRPCREHKYVTIWGKIDNCRRVYEILQNGSRWFLFFFLSFKLSYNWSWTSDLPISIVVVLQWRSLLVTIQRDWRMNPSTELVSWSLVWCEWRLSKFLALVYELSYHDFSIHGERN